MSNWGATKGAGVERHRAPSGNRDSDHFRAYCVDCGWAGTYHSNRTTEGRRLAERDRDQHRCRLPAGRVVQR